MMKVYRHTRRYESYVLKKRLGAGLLVLLFLGGFLSQAVGLKALGKEERQLSIHKNDMGEIIKVRVESEEIALPMEEYIIGVVAAEMPASFPFEALKAQSVAARTYGARWLKKAESIPADASLAQSWISKEEMRIRWGDRYEEDYQKIASAVLATKGEVLYWQDDLADCLYHASCGGVRTASADEIWGGHVECLKSVSCPHGEDPFCNNEIILQANEVNALFGVNITEIEINSYTKSGRVGYVNVGEEVYSGEKFRGKLGLRSTRFQLMHEKDILRIVSQGYGHGVGLCQYGTAYYANRGWDYKEILFHYYTDVQIGKM